MTKDIADTTFFLMLHMSSLHATGMIFIDLKKAAVQFPWKNQDPPKTLVVTPAVTSPHIDPVVLVSLDLLPFEIVMEADPPQFLLRVLGLVPE